MDPQCLEEAIERDLANNICPTLVVATIGSTGTGAIDDLKAIGAVCRKHNVFLHIDAAWAGSALILDEYRWMIEGAEHFDSFCFNPTNGLAFNSIARPIL